MRKRDLEDLLEWVTNGRARLNEHRPHFELSSRHLSCVGAQRQNVLLAAQVVSNKTAEALLMRDPDKKPFADFLNLFNNW